MRLLDIRLCPFAGLTDKRIVFGPRLTVVRGDNEAGKSTVFRALASVLFARTDLTPARLRDFTRPILPIGGGDTVAVEICFEHEGGKYQLRRQWGGAGSAARLTLPDGSIISQETTVVERLKSMLGATEGTYRSVLLTYQSELGHTLKTLSDDGETTRALGDLLTSAVQETDGVSIEGFKAKLQAECEEYYSHWDSARGGPESGRGIQNPWRKSVGRVLKAWYEKETCRQAWTQAKETEDRVDELNARLAAANAECGALQAYIKTHGAAAESVSKRQTITAQEELLAEQFRKLKQANMEWPQLEQAIGDLDQRRQTLETLRERLTREADAARLADAQRHIREQFTRVEGRQKQLSDARTAFGAIPVLDADTMKTIAGLAARGRELQARLAGGHLKARLTVSQPLTVALQCGAGALSTEQVQPGHPRDLAADGTFRIEHDQWTLEVEAGTGDFPGIAREFEESSAALTELLKTHGAVDEDEARRLHTDYERARQAVVAAEKNLSDELAGKTFDELEASAAASRDAGAARPLADVTADQARNIMELENLHKDLVAKNGRIEALKSTYGDQDSLLDAVGELKIRQKNLAKQRDALPPLPPGVTDAAAFVAEYQNKVDDLKRLLSEKSSLEIDIAGIRLLDNSAEELEALYREADETFNATLRKAAVITRIQKAVEEVEDDAASTDPYAGLKADVERYVAQMTDNRYERIQATGALPSGFIRQDGELIGAELLSTGTKDVLGLALRLAMSRHFLGEQKGFLVMDDPLVDMDLRRQAAAAAALAEHSRTMQVVVFTCHPAHADLLGGTAVEL